MVTTRDCITGFALCLRIKTQVITHVWKTLSPAPSQVHILISWSYIPLSCVAHFTSTLEIFCRSIHPSVQSSLWLPASYCSDPYWMNSCLLSWLDSVFQVMGNNTSKRWRRRHKEWAQPEQEQWRHWDCGEQIRVALGMDRKTWHEGRRLFLESPVICVLEAWVSRRHYWEILKHHMGMLFAGAFPQRGIRQFSKQNGNKKSHIRLYLSPFGFPHWCASFPQHMLLSLQPLSRMFLYGVSGKSVM